jgi:hypothetical protein
MTGKGQVSFDEHLSAIAGIVEGEVNVEVNRALKPIRKWMGATLFFSSAYAVVFAVISLLNGMMGFWAEFWFLLALGGCWIWPVYKRARPRELKVAVRYGIVDEETGNMGYIILCGEREKEE